MSASFPRASRLTRPAEFKQVFANPHQRSSDCYFTLLGYFHSSSPPQLRLGLVVAKKRIAKAHDRNRVKRIVRESFRHLETTERSMDIVVIVKSAAAAVDNQTLFTVLRKHWQRLLQ